MQYLIYCFGHKGELLRTTGYALKENGYKIKVLDLIDMDKSDCYNPFVYIREDNDIFTPCIQHLCEYNR